MIIFANFMFIIGAGIVMGLVMGLVEAAWKDIRAIRRIRSKHTLTTTKTIYALTDRCNCGDVFEKSDRDAGVVTGAWTSWIEAHSPHIHEWQGPPPTPAIEEWLKKEPTE